ncbi:MAG: HD domain-containing protein [Desulfobacteraceae bacterium]|nr:MAG: HD domain-containing protein [Desulfobacteraceae bacterium]
MNSIYEKIRNQALDIASRYPATAFYQNFPEQVAFSLRTFESDPVVGALHDFVAGHTEDDFGHGLHHAVKVAQDAGALAAIEGRCFSSGNDGFISDDQMGHRVRMAQCAGLLHDIRRKHKNHAQEGAVFAEKVLERYAFSRHDIMDVCLAIENHEAFKETKPGRSLEGSLLSDCLYDADKFRWGVENFTHTVWAMVSYANIPIRKFMDAYPSGIVFLEKIKTTFRTPTGKIYGPEFIDQGLSLGEQLYSYIQTEFARYL